MKTPFKALLATLWVLTAPGAQAAHTRAELILADTAAKPGDTVLAGIHLTMDPGWHTYWKNSGASGEPTRIDWSLPPGVTAGDIQWPVPEKLGPEDLTTYVYSGETLLLVPLKLAPDLKPGSLDLNAKVSWLECQEQCVPGSAQISATLGIGPETRAAAAAALLDQWRRNLPQSAAGLSVRAWWGAPASGDSRPLILKWATTITGVEADFFPDDSKQFEVQPATERIKAEPGTIRLRKVVKKFEGDWPNRISGLLIQRTDGARQAFAVTLPVGAPQAALGGPARPPLWRMMIYAFIGGLILNVMPCVLPVIALKILGFVRQAKEAPRRVRALGLIYGAGVLVSFLALAGIVVGVQAAGHRAGWGMQFSNPQFVVLLTVLVLLVALNLFGVFEVTLGGRVMGAAGNLAAKHGAAGAFFNGVLATVLATPCTAPFLGAALGFAFAQPAAVIVLMFLTIGLGLAAPYVVLSWNPAWLKFLPAPGAWMERFKVAMGFPMLATAVWLFNLTPVYYGKRVWWLGLFLVVVALAAWIFGEFVQRGRAHKGLAAALTLVLLAGGYAFAVESQLNWRQPLPPESASGFLRESPDGIAWERWSPEKVAQARAAGRPVFADFTADWCLTCQVNKKTSLEIPSVRARLKAINAVALLGDYTRFPDSITEELNRFGRAGVPLVLVYPKQADRPAIVLPEVLTPDIVLNALDQAAK